ncbi:hypothetical protein D3C85_1403640 [compost metagenome]
MNTGAARVDECCDHIDVARSAFHALLILNPAQQADLITQLGGSLELQIDRGVFHPGGQLIGQRIAAPLKEHHRVPHIFRVDLGLNQTDTGSLTPFDLVLQAWTRPILVIAVFALANKKRLL